MPRGDKTTEAPEHSSRAGAEALAARIVAYWAERGRTVNARIESAGLCGRGAGYAVWGVRSDLKLEIPPSCSTPAAALNGRAARPSTPSASLEAAAGAGSGPVVCTEQKKREAAPITELPLEGAPARAPASADV